MLSICVRQQVLLSISVFANFIQADEDGWKVVNKMGYKMVTTKRGWLEQQDHCRSIGGQLASVPDKATLDLLVDMMKNAKPAFGTHIGARWANPADAWVWTDGTPWSFQNWADQEPSPNPTNQPRFVTVEINSGIFEDGEWNDVEQDDVKNALCQKNMGEGTIANFSIKPNSVSSHIIMLYHHIIICSHTR